MPRANLFSDLNLTLREITYDRTQPVAKANSAWLIKRNAFRHEMKFGYRGLTHSSDFQVLNYTSMSTS